MLVNWLSFITIYLNINAIIYTFLKYTFLLRFVWCCFNEQITKLKQNKIVQYKSCCYNAFLTVKFCFNFKASSPPPLMPGISHIALKLHVVHPEDIDMDNTNFNSISSGGARGGQLHFDI